jgi:hypothetical protein
MRAFIRDLVAEGTTVLLTPSTWKKPTSSRAPQHRHRPGPGDRLRHLRRAQGPARQRPDRSRDARRRPGPGHHGAGRHGCGAPAIDRARAQVTIPVCDPVPDLMAALRTLDATRAPRSKTVRSPGPPEFRPGRMIWPSICGVVPVPARTDRSAPRNRSRAANPPSITTDRECWSCPRLGPGGPLCRTGPDHRGRSVRTSPRSRRHSVEGDDQSDHRQGARGDERLGPAPRCGLCRGVDPRDGG